MKDTEIHFPHFTLLKASAGSGKTYTLTKRFAQFILSDKIPRNRLKNMLAITFSNNAAREMKERTLLWLKALCLGHEKEERELSALLSLDRGKMRDRAGLLIDEILENYSDFQVRTIDSFMTTVFRTSAVDFGYNPEFEILMNSDTLLEYSFNLFLRAVKEGTAEAAYFEEIIDSLTEQRTSDASFLWDPSTVLLGQIKAMYRRIASTGKRAKIEDHDDALRAVKEKIAGLVEAIEKEIESSGLKRHGNSSFKAILPLVRAKSFPDLIGRTHLNPPVTRPQTAAEQAVYERVLALWSEAVLSMKEYSVLFARSRCTPSLKAYNAFSRTVESAKRQQGKVFIEDINMHLAEYLDGALVPDVYFRIGETVFHFLVDEFQDTSPIQWRNLFPLIENSLSQGGSLFAVGDTKQAIYGFRNADYRIMKRLEDHNPFPSAAHEVEEMDTNYRSGGKILEFNERVFKERIVRLADYREAGERSGLTTYVQRPKDEEKGSYAEVTLLRRDDADPEEKRKIQGLAEGLHARGFRYGDIAILTPTNDDAARASSWLNEKNIPFISYSSLDVRRRKVTGEIVALLNFLDSPTDNFAFGTFLLGDVCASVLMRDHGVGSALLREFCFRRRNERYLYKAFEAEFSDIWKRRFGGLFRASGFLPLYDLVTDIFAVFKVFENFPDEEAALVKILEVVKEFEGAGFNTLGDFLETAVDGGEDESRWNMAVPKGIDAVQVMTIHKAKGLGFPVAIVLLYQVTNRGFEFIVEEDEESVCLLKINKAAASCDPGFQRLYDEERMKELVNRLNTLYVGFTRPERELYVIGVRSDDRGYPFDLLPAEDYPPSGNPDGGTGSPPPFSASPGTCRLVHRRRQLDFSAALEEHITLEEKRRGEFIHRALALFGYRTAGFERELEAIVERVRDETGVEYPGDEVKEVLIGLIGHKEAGLYFAEAPGREVRKEQEYADASGRLFRMDRVVIDPECVTVIDFKTGSRKAALEQYRAQIGNYMRILRDVYRGKTVKGALVFIDLGEVVEVA